MNKKNLIPVHSYTQLYWDIEKKRYYAIARLDVTQLDVYKEEIILIEENEGKT